MIYSCQTITNFDAKYIRTMHTGNVALDDIWRSMHEKQFRYNRSVA